MFVETKIWGKQKIEKVVVQDLIKSKALQRLKGIDQGGYSKPYWPTHTVTRFEHSLGCFFLLKKFGASLEEQIAGLIHDVSHSAFSHCIDYVLSAGSEKTQNHQDNIFEEYVLQTDIPVILKKYNLDIDYILDENNFPLQETELPDLCADRIDYSLLSLFYLNEIDIKKLYKIINNFKIIDSKWVFCDFNIAKEYAELFFYLNKKYYSGFSSALMFRTVGDYLKYSLEKNYLRKKDLYLTNQVVIDLINVNLNSDKNLQKLWKRMNNPDLSKKVNFDSNFDVQVFCKSRVVDPLFLDNGEVKRLSNFYSKWKRIVKEESKPKKYFIRFF